MKIVLDASALVAMVTGEHDADALVDMVDQHPQRFYCAIGAWEAVRAVARKRDDNLDEAAAAIEATLAAFDVELAPLGEVEWQLALAAHRRYGKGTGHPARLNMGDCFAYACAKANDAILLYKGANFIHTDLA